MAEKLETKIGISPKWVKGRARGLIFSPKQVNYAFGCGNCGETNMGVLPAVQAEHKKGCDVCGALNKFYIVEH